MKLSIEYCAVRGYRSRAVADQILGEFEDKLDDFTLIPSRGGVFEVVVGEELVYSKRETGRHADYAEIGLSRRTAFGRLESGLEPESR